MSSLFTRSSELLFILSHGQVPSSVSWSRLFLRISQEDPSEDMRQLEVSSADSMFVITSAGDNALHYAAASSPQRVGSQF